MVRIYAVLASVATAFLFATVLLGLTLDDAAARKTEADVLWMQRHFLIGISTAIFVVLVHCIGYTYFVGTSRWCKEVVETYRLDPALVQQSNQLKRRTFPWAVIGFFTMLGIIALGARSDPGTGLKNTADWTNFHLAAALGGTSFICFTFYSVWNRIRENQKIIETILQKVAEIRSEKGLTQAEDPKNL